MDILVLWLKTFCITVLLLHNEMIIVSKTSLHFDCHQKLLRSLAWPFVRLHHVYVSDREFCSEASSQVLTFFMASGLHAIFFNTLMFRVVNCTDALAESSECTKTLSEKYHCVSCRFLIGQQNNEHCKMP